jgi:hypothetical protein
MNVSAEKSNNHDNEQSDNYTSRRNPRLVYGDPDRFFNDLLMEQQEQS